MNPVVHAANHEGADGTHLGDTQAFRLAPFQALLDGFPDGQGLRDAKRDSGVDADASIGGLGDGFHTGVGGRYFHLHVGRELTEMDGLLQDRIRVAVKGRVRLDG